MPLGETDFSIVGSSPEALVTVNDGWATTHPIAGTRWRGENEEEDQLLEKELLADEKERAEHLMLVDLGRNDLGRVCTPGTVRVEDYSHIERYSHVMHLVSTVTGMLAEGRTALDAVTACFPAGTLSGAPKVRAMELIEEVEKTRRGLYGGVVGYLDFAGNADFAIAIRTALMRDGTAYVQAGGGVVADSNGLYEHNEASNKARAVLNAIAAAETLGAPKTEPAMTEARRPEDDPDSPAAAGGRRRRAVGGVAAALGGDPVVRRAGSTHSGDTVRRDVVDGPAAVGAAHAGHGRGRAGGARLAAAGAGGAAGGGQFRGRLSRCQPVDAAGRGGARRRPGARFAGVAGGNRAALLGSGGRGGRRGVHFDRRRLLMRSASARLARPGRARRNTWRPAPGVRLPAAMTLTRRSRRRQRRRRYRNG